FPTNLVNPPLPLPHTRYSLLLPSSSNIHIAMAHNTFNLPHLVENIAQYLHPQDVSNCALVSQEWSTWFTPELWAHIDIENDIIRKGNGFAGLANNSIHIREITSCSTESLPRINALLPLVNLRLFEFVSNEVVSVTDTLIVNFLPLMPSLQCLIMRTAGLRQDENSGLFLQALRTHPTLRRLDLRPFEIPYFMFMQELMEACTNYESLTLEVSGPLSINSMQDEEDYDSACKAIELIAGMRARDLTIRPLRSLPYIELSILGRCPQLERLKLLGVDDPLALQNLSVLFGNNVCPMLKSFCLGKVNSPSVEKDAAVAFMVRALGNVNNNVNSMEIDEAEVEIKGLDTFALGYRCLRAIGTQLCQGLIQFHGRTLVCLEFGLNPRMSFQDLVECANGLSSLRSLQAVVDLTEKLNQDAEAVTQALGKEWSCLGLEKLSIRLFMFKKPRNFVDPQWDVSAVGVCTRYLFVEMGRLVKLKELYFQCSTNLLKLQQGYLSDLSELKQLTVLSVEEGPNIILDGDDATWMIENWPRLVEFEIMMKRNKKRGPSLANFRNSLTGQRPWLAVKVKYTD
ncbi:hypothetical protein BGX27_003251, partial [Mortierella sp. AM989]